MSTPTELERVVDLIPCLNDSCNKNGVITNQEGEPEQCEWCYRVRFAVRDEIATYAQTVAEEAVRVERAKTIKNIVAITIKKDENELFVLRYREKVVEALTPLPDK